MTSKQQVTILKRWLENQINNLMYSSDVEAHYWGGVSEGFKLCLEKIDKLKKARK
jgi:hypothetical protein